MDYQLGRQMSIEDSPQENSANASHPCPIRCQKGRGRSRGSRGSAAQRTDILAATPRAWTEVRGSTATIMVGTSRRTGGHGTDLIRIAKRSIAISVATPKTEAEERGATDTSGAVGTTRRTGGGRASERRTTKPAFRHQVKLPEKQ